MITFRRSTTNGWPRSKRRPRRPATSCGCAGAGQSRPSTPSGNCPPQPPQVAAPTRVAGLAGRNLQLVEHRVLKRLARVGVKLGLPARRMTRGYALTDDLALTLGLLFRALAPMRSRDCGRWSKASKRWAAKRRPTGSAWPCTGRVLTALRMLLTEPRPRGGGR